ncbi:MAG: hypothetical protein R8J41_16370 [Alphaproteobacteria bacterium]|nr:hypothetical protein [Alphaproteobacteria bacterium]
MKDPFQAILHSSRFGRPFLAAFLAILVAGCQTTSGQQPSQHKGLFERGPRGAVVGEHGTYNIAWITLQDQILLQKPVYEVLVSYHPTNRGPGGVKERHWNEMMLVAQDEIARRCIAPAQGKIISSSRDYDPQERAMGAEIRVNYTCN